MNRRLFLSFAVAGCASLVLKELPLPYGDASDPVHGLRMHRGPWLLGEFVSDAEECVFYLTSPAGNRFSSRLVKSRIDFTPFSINMRRRFGWVYASPDPRSLNTWRATPGNEVIIEDLGPLAENLIALSPGDT